VLVADAALIEEGTRMRFGLVAFVLALAVCGTVSSQTNTITTVSAASFIPSLPLAPGVIAAGYGTNLTSTIEIAPATGVLPTVLAQTSVTVKDSAGVKRAAPLWFVSSSQINYYLPEETALGQATITVMRNSQTVATGTLQIDTVAPGLFTMNANGQGVPAALAIFAKGDGSQTWQYVFNAGCALGSCQPVPLDLGPATDTVFLQFYGTGIRGRSSLGAVTAKIGGLDAPVEYAGPVSGMVGLDQVNLRVPRSLSGRGEVDVVLTVDGRLANTVTVNIGKVSGNAPHSVSLSWTASSSPNVTGYNVYRAITSGGPYRKVNSALIVGTSYVDTTVQSGQTYYYVATAADNNSSESAYSNEAPAWY
jgi:uncharacterized protein (TIGR03437 family)